MCVGERAGMRGGRRKGGREGCLYVYIELYYK